MACFSWTLQMLSAQYRRSFLGMGTNNLGSANFSLEDLPGLEDKNCLLCGGRINLDDLHFHWEWPLVYVLTRLARQIVYLSENAPQVTRALQWLIVGWRHHYIFFITSCYTDWLLVEWITRVHYFFPLTSCCSTLRMSSTLCSVIYTTLESN